MKPKYALIGALSLIFSSLAAPYDHAEAQVRPMARDAVSERQIYLYNNHTEESLNVVYWRNGRYIASAVDDIEHLLRDHRRNVSTTIDKELLDLLFDIKQSLERAYPSTAIRFHVISGYRSRETNNMLRRTRGGQGSNSRHIHGDAIDIMVPGIPARVLRDHAWCQQEGGVGYYQKGQYVHIDTHKARRRDSRFPGGSRYRAWGWSPRPGQCN